MHHTVGIISIFLVVGSVAFTGFAFGHGTEKHGKMIPVDARMKKLHAMMPIFSVATAGLETALETGEIPAVESEAGKILAAIPDLKKSKPHKNINQKNKFVELATNLEKAVVSTVDLAIKGNIAEAKAAFKKVEAVCAACHAKFRD